MEGGTQKLIIKFKVFSSWKLYLNIFNLFFRRGLTLWLIVCSLNKLKMINNFKGHPVLDRPLSLVMFFWPSSRSMHGAKNRILGNHRIFHERGQGSRPNSIYVKQTLFFLIGNCFRTHIIQKWRILDQKWLKKKTPFELIWSLRLHILS